jgi:hypothetical protein
MKKVLGGLIIIAFRKRIHLRTHAEPAIGQWTHKFRLYKVI